MGTNKRAADREAQRRATAGELRRIIIAWKQRDGKWEVNFLDRATCAPLTRQRVYPSAESIRGFVSRSMTTLGGPRRVLYSQALLKGFGEIEVEITGVEFDRLTSS